MHEEVNKALAAGETFRANEITANVMVGTTMLIIFVFMLICWLLNEIGVFTADEKTMRIAVLLASIVEVPITVLNSIHVGTKPWLKISLMVDLTLVCAILSAALGHNVTLIMVFPMLVSTRYFDEKYTKNVAIFSAFIFAVSCVFCGFFGILNLNMVSFPDGAELAVMPGGNLRDAILECGIDRTAYLKSLILNEFIPRVVVFLAMSVTCRYISSRGKRMIEIQAENAKKTSRIETELNLATEIQTSMLPCLLPAFPGHENIELRAVYHPAKEVGGDFYDYFIIDKTHVGIVIADVSGKGVGAALFMTISKTVLKNQLQLGISPEEALTNANRQLCENNNADLFVTCWAGVFNTETGVLSFVNAGHNPPVILRKGENAEFIKQNRGFVLAGIDGYRYKLQELHLSTGDEMFFYTDGVTEATNAANELYGDSRLIECIRSISDRDVAEQLTLLKEDIDGFVGGADQFDDITIMAMRIT